MCVFSVCVCVLCVCVFSVCVCVLCVCADLEVYVLNTEADLQDVTFPHSYDSDSILHMSARALQQYSHNGNTHTHTHTHTQNTHT